MTEIVAARLSRFDTDKDDCVGFAIADDANMGFQVSMPRHVARLLILYLSGAIAKLEQAMPEEDRTDGQVLPVIDCQTATAGDQAVLILHLEGGADIPLALDSGALASLSAELVLQGATASQRPN